MLTSINKTKTTFDTEATKMFSLSLQNVTKHRINKLDPSTWNIEFIKI